MSNNLSDLIDEVGSIKVEQDRLERTAKGLWVQILEFFDEDAKEYLASTKINGYGCQFIDSTFQRNQITFRFDKGFGEPDESLYRDEGLDEFCRKMAEKYKVSRVSVPYYYYGA